MISVNDLLAQRNIRAHGRLSVPSFLATPLQRSSATSVRGDSSHSFRERDGSGEKEKEKKIGVESPADPDKSDGFSFKPTLQKQLTKKEREAIMKIQSKLKGHLEEKIWSYLGLLMQIVNF